MKTEISTAASILGCARNLIVAGGYNGFSYADIASAIGIRKASIHHHFPTKADLVRTLVKQYREEAAAGLASLERDVADPFEQLRLYIGYWQACIADATAPVCICALLASELPLLPNEVALEVRTHFRALSSWLEDTLARGIRQDRFRLHGTAAAEAEAFMASVHGAMISARAYADANVFRIVTEPLLERLSLSAKGSRRNA